MTCFFYYLTTKTNDSEFKKTMRKFKLDYQLKKVDLFNKKYTFIKMINQDQQTYFFNLLTFGLTNNLFSFIVYSASDIMIYDKQQAKIDHMIEMENLVASKIDDQTEVNSLS